MLLCFYEKLMEDKMPPPQKKNMIIENSLDEQNETTLFSTFFHLTKMQNAMSFILC